MELILKYFPELSLKQKEQFASLGTLYGDWNEKINVISRKDIDNLYLHHVLHSLALARYNPFTTQMKILDAGTGGGFPGIPLAIFFPEVHFTLLDSTAKKIKVVKEVTKSLALENVQTVHARVEDHKGEYDIVTSRAVSSLTQMVGWTKHLVPDSHWAILKGGSPKEIRKELPPLYRMEFIPISAYFSEDYFIDKFIVDINYTSFKV
jgi:16S rRNA (guanine527-N7)-methyltransferase